MSIAKETSVFKAKSFRKLLVALAVCAASLGFSSTSTWAATPAPLHIVKLLNFGCPVCRASEANDPTIEAAARDAGATLSYAPVPISGDAPTSREQVYYAIRPLGPQVEREVRESLYKGAQDAGQVFDTTASVLVWLHNDLPKLKLNSAAVEKAAADEAPLRRAVRLVMLAHTTSVPDYVFIQDGQVIGSVSPATLPAGETISAAVIAKIKALTAKTKGGSRG
jgi:hypothetical protein